MCDNCFLSHCILESLNSSFSDHQDCTLDMSNDFFIIESIIKETKLKEPDHYVI